MAKVEVEISPDGKVKVHVIGVSGPSCIPLTKALEMELGTVERTVKTGDYYQVPNAPTSQKQKVTQ